MLSVYRNRRFSKIISIMLTFCMIVPLFMVFPAYEAKAAEESIVDESFESYDLDKDIDQNVWKTTSGAGQKTVLEATNLTEHTGKVFKIKRTSSGTFMVTKEIEKAKISTGKVTVSWQMNADKTDALGFFIVKGSNGSTVAQIDFDKHGKISLNEDGGSFTLQPYEKEKWYEIKLILDTNTKTYDVYIDNTLIKSQRGFRKSANDIGRIVVGVSGYGNINATLLYDNIKVYKTLIDVESVELNKTSTRLSIGSSEQLIATVKPENATDKNVVWSSDNEDVATVDATGNVTAIGEGNTNITVTTQDGVKTAQCSVEVYKETGVIGVTLNKESINLGIQKSYQLKASINPETADNKNLTWSSDSPKEVAVDQDGLVTATTSSTTQAVITVTTEDGNKTAMCNVNVYEKANTPIWKEDFETYETGSTSSVFKRYNGNGTLTVEDNKEQSKVLKLDSPTVGGSSLLANKSLNPQEGIVSVSAKINSQQTNAAPYFIITDNNKKFAVQIQFDVNGNIAINEGTLQNIQPYDANKWYDVKVIFNTYSKTFDLYIDGVLKESNHNFRNSVNNIGQIVVGVAGVSAGKVLFDDIKVENIIQAEVSDIILNQESLELETGEISNLVATVEPDDASQNVTWTSNNEEVATVDQNGEITAIKEGTAIITVTSDYDNSVKVTCEVTVSSIKAKSITLNKTEVKLCVDSKEALYETILPENTTNKNVTWESSNPEIATVNAYGEITAIKEGEATITAIADENNTINTSCKVVVISYSIQQEFYVSLDGNDSNIGTKENPFRTIEKARDTISNINSDMTGDIIVYIGEGTYTLADTLVFTEQDSGTNGFDIIYKGYENKKPVISGGKKIIGWTLYDKDKNIYKASFGGEIETRQLYVNGERAVRARSTKGLSSATYNAIGHTTSDLFLADWKNINDIEMVYKQNWTSPRCGVESIELNDNKSKAIITMKQPGWKYCRNKGYTSTTKPWYYENAYELLDSEGEWYLDRTGAIDSNDYTFYYKPKEGQDMSKVEVVVPVLEDLVTVEGSSLDTPVHNIQFDNISFQHATWLRPNGNIGIADAQNNVLREDYAPEKYTLDGYPWKDVMPGGNIKLITAKNILFNRCEFTKLGNTALYMKTGSQDNLVRGCQFYDISGNAIQVGETDMYDANNFMPKDKRYILKNNDVINNYIDNIGVEYRSSSAIGASYVQDMDIMYNEIGNVPYCGIHIGWGWVRILKLGVPYSGNNRIEYNYIHDVMTELMDGGAIYTLGPQNSDSNPSTIKNNYIDKQKHLYGALYLDEGSIFYNIKNNVINDVVNWILIKDVRNTVINTYTNQSKGISKTAPGSSEKCEFQNTVIVNGEEWPKEALSIIENAGLQAEYEDIKTTEPKPEEPKPYTVNGTIDKTKGIEATVTITPTVDVEDHVGNEVVVFQLMKGTTPVSIMALEKDITSEDSLKAYFSVEDPDNTEYTVEVFVFDKFNSDTSMMESLSNKLELK